MNNQQFCEWASRHGAVIGRGLAALGNDPDAVIAITELMLLDAGGGPLAGRHGRHLAPALSAVGGACQVPGCTQFKGHAGPHDEPL